MFNVNKQTTVSSVYQRVAIFTENPEHPEWFIYEYAARKGFWLTWTTRLEKYVFCMGYEFKQENGPGPSVLIRFVQ